MKLGTYRVSLDRPGAGWDCEVKARSAREAMKLANNLHPNMGLADSVYEVPFVPDALHNYKMATKNLKMATKKMLAARHEYNLAILAEQEANGVFARARAIYNMSKE